MKTFILAILAFFALPVFAVGIGNDNPPGGGGGVQVQGQQQGQAQITSVSNRISNESRANAAAFAGSASQSTNALTVNLNEAAVPTNTRNEQAGTIGVRTVPNVFAGNVYPTAPCMGSSTVGAAALGWGASVGTSWADDECGIRETARSFQNLGLMRDAVDILCSSKYAAVAPVCIASKPPKAE